MSEHSTNVDERGRVAGPVLAFGLVLLVVVGGVFAVSTQLEESPPAEPLTVEYTVTNVGGDSATATVSLAVGGNETATARERVNTAERGRGTLSARGLATEYESGDAIPVTVSVDGNETANGSVIVGDGAPASPPPVNGFFVSVADTTAPTQEGENVTVTATIENTGASTDTQTITLDGDGLGTNSTSVTLGAGNSTTVDLAVNTTAGDAAVYQATVSSDDDEAATPLVVFDPDAGAEPALVTADIPARVDAGGATGELIQRGAEAVPTVLVPLVVLVGGIGVVGFVVGALGPLRRSGGGGR